MRNTEGEEEEYADDIEEPYSYFRNEEATCRLAVRRIVGFAGRDTLLGRVSMGRFLLPVHGDKEEGGG